VLVYIVKYVALATGTGAVHIVVMTQTLDKREDPRRARLLDAAFSVFGRFGFRKTSMEEVAQAAHVSRQALYLHFATKEDLFRATVEHALARNVTAARAALAGPGELERRLVEAFDEWIGRFVGMMGSGATDLAEVGGALAGEMLQDYEARFLAALTAALEESGLMKIYAAAGLTSRQLAENLEATARGLKHGCASRDHFLERIGVAVRTLCAPMARGA
jgi:AcrR family transcriptional regulator